MIENNDINELKKQIDDVELVPDEELKNMDFYELAYYMQTLNVIDDVFNNTGDGDK